MKRPILLGGALAGLAAIMLGVMVVQAEPETGSQSNVAQVFVEKLAGVLHLTPQQTTDALKKAELQTVDQLVKDGNLTQSQGDRIKERIESGPEFRFRRFHAFDREVLRDVGQAELKALANVLGLSPEELRDTLRSGKTIRELAAAKGVTQDQIRGALREAAKGVLDQAVKDGKITQAQEDRILKAIESGRFRFFGHRSRDDKGTS